MEHAADRNAVDANVDQKLKEAYFTASQGQLVWSRFKRIRSAMIAAYILVFLVICGPVRTVSLALQPDHCGDVTRIT